MSKTVSAIIIMVTMLFTAGCTYYHEHTAKAVIVHRYTECSPLAGCRTAFIVKMRNSRTVYRNSCNAFGNIGDTVRIYGEDCADNCEAWKEHDHE